MLPPLSLRLCSAIFLSFSLAACTFIFEEGGGTEGVDVPGLTGNFYISPNGDDDNDGKDPTRPFQTWSTALAILTPGDVLIALPGVYSDEATADGKATELPNIDCVSNVGCDGPCPPGAIGNPIEVWSSEPRQAILRPSNSWAAETLRIRDCQAWTVGGFIVEGALDPPDGAEEDVIRVSGGNNITLSGLLVHRDNVNVGGELLSVGGSSDLVVEDSGFYDFRNKAIVLVEATSARIRRVHVSGARSMGGGPEDDCANNGDIAVQVSGSADVVFDNIVVEGACQGMKIQPIGLQPSEGTKIYSSLVSSTGTGIECQVDCFACGEDEECCNTKGSCLDLRVQNTVIQGGRVGLELQSPVGAVVENVTIQATNSAAINVKNEPPEPPALLVPSAAVQMALISRTLIFNSDDGIDVTLSENTTKVESCNVDVTGETYIPANFLPTDSFAVDPQSTGCVAQPSSSWVMRNILGDGTTIGANVKFRTVEGAETTEELWEHEGFPCGALIQGVNDTGLSSCSDIHVRFGLGLEQCPLPDSPP